MAKPLPKYRQFRPSNLAFVEIAGKRIYLGRFGSEDSKERYRQALEEMQHRQAAEAIADQVAVPAAAALTVAELCLAYLQWADEYCVEDGRRTPETYMIRAASRSLRKRGLAGCGLGVRGLPVVEGFAFDRAAGRCGKAGGSIPPSAIRCFDRRFTGLRAISLAVARFVGRGGGRRFCRWDGRETARPPACSGTAASPTR